MDEEFVEFVLDQLQSFGSVQAKRMFGGHGLYHGPKFFGIIHDGRFYMKANDQTRDDYVAAGMEPFRPNAKQTLKNYYEVPIDVLEDVGRLAQWAQRSVD